MLFLGVLQTGQDLQIAIPSSGPLHLLLPLPGMIYPQIPARLAFLTYFKSLLICHLFSEDLLDYPILNCHPHIPLSPYPTLFFPQHLLLTI